MKVKDIMTSNLLKYCNPETSIHDAEVLMKINNLRVLPVLDNSNKVVGLITDHDIKNTLSKVHGKLSALLNVGEIMIKKIHTVNADDNISSALDYMIKNQVGSVPVVDENGKLKGIVSLFKLISINNNRVIAIKRMEANSVMEESF